MNEPAKHGDSVELLHALFDAVRDGRLESRRAVIEWQQRILSSFSATNVTTDTSRQERTGFPEVIYAAGKSPEDVATAARTILDRHDRLLVTRADERHFAAIEGFSEKPRYHATAKVVTVGLSDEKERNSGLVAVVTGGSSDVPVAEEAALTAEIIGARVVRHFDIGIAGLHRLLERLEALRQVDVIIAIAGFEGALPSVIAGLVSTPVIAVPTSVGYGASFGGLAALLAMLHSCGPGVTVVNIDNGFGAGFAAGRILGRMARNGRGAPDGAAKE